MTLRYGIFVPLFAASLVVLVPVVAAGLVVCRCEQTYKRILLFGSVTGAVAGVGCAVAMQISQPDSVFMRHGPWGWGLDVLAWGTAGTTGALLGCLLASLCRFAVRATGRTLLVQTGTLCWKCGYDLGPPPVDRCPECATPAQAHRFRSPRLVRLVHTVVHGGRWIGWVGAAALALMVLWMEVCQRLPRERFMRALGPDARWGVLMRHPRPGEGLPIALWVRGRSGSSGGIAIEPEWDAMGRVQRTRLLVAEEPGAATSWCQPGTPLVQVFLGRDESRRLMRDGLPPLLVDGLLSRATDLGWAPTPQSSWSGEPVEPPDAMDPRPFFPDANW